MILNRPSAQQPKVLSMLINFEPDNDVHSLWNTQPNTKPYTRYDEGLVSS